MTEQAQQIAIAEVMGERRMKKLVITQTMDLNILLKSLTTAKAALENERKFVQQQGSEDDTNLNHDAIFHINHCLKIFNL